MNAGGFSSVKVYRYNHQYFRTSLYNNKIKNKFVQVGGRTLKAVKEAIV